VAENRDLWHGTVYVYFNLFHRFLLISLQLFQGGHVLVLNRVGVLSKIFDDDLMVVFPLLGHDFFLFASFLRDVAEEYFPNHRSGLGVV
jgi:hypothetical protein